MRKSSGLVRAFSPFDALFYNILAINPWILSALTFTVVVIAYPGASPWLAALITMGFCLFEAMAYAILVTLMPRTGGDYVFQSRVFGGGVATFLAFSGIVIAEIIAILNIAVVAANIVFSPFLTMAGLYYEASWMTEVGEWFGTNTGLFVTAIVCTIWMAVINIVGMRAYARLQRYSFIFGALGIAIILIVMLFTSHSDFINGFNGFMSDHAGVNNAYESVIKEAGPVNTGFNLSATFACIPLIASGLIFPAWGAMQAGEIRRAGTFKWNAMAIVGAELICGILIALTAALLISRTGSHFFAAAGIFSESENSFLPTGPYFSFFATVMFDSPIMAWILFITANLWLWMWFPNLTLAITRVGMAMSFDGLLPRWVGDVNPRFHTPVKAIVAASIGMVIVAVMFLIGIELTQILAAIGFMSILAFAVTVLGAALIPYMRPQLWASAPEAIKKRVIGVPVTVICAVVFVPFAIWFMYRCLSDERLGMTQSKVLIPMICFYIASFLIYVIPAMIRRQRGELSVGDRFKELPVE